MEHIITREGYLELGESVVGSSPIEGYGVIKQTVELSNSPVKEMISGTLIDAPKWLPFAAEKYQISANINDYVIVPVTIMYSDLPNRNMVSFPFNELTSFNPSQAQLAYTTWKGRPTFVEHQNQDYTQAKGVVFSVALRPLKAFKGNLHRVQTLLGFDRKRDPELASGILSGIYDKYSMGATCSDYRCSICNASMAKSDGQCEHIDIRTATSRIRVREFGGKLAYRMAIDPTAIEVSMVKVPAYHMATSRPLL
jgi:hypothetical protein